MLMEFSSWGKLITVLEFEDSRFAGQISILYGGSGELNFDLPVGQVYTAADF